MRISRRGLLSGGGVAAATVATGGLGVERGWLPGRVFLQAHLGLNGTDGVVPDVEPGPVDTGAFASAARLGATTRWMLLRPPGSTSYDLPVVVALHGLHWRLDGFLPGGLGLPEFLAATVAAGTPPFAIVAAEGGDSYWHRRPSGEDAGAMITHELMPMLAERGLRCGEGDRIGLLGWSMGGYGALRLAGTLGAARVASVAVAGPAVWEHADDASGSGFTDAAEYDAATVFGHQGDLAGVAVSVDCGTGDPFFRDAEAYVDGFPADADVRSRFEPGAHDRGFWRRMLPDQLAFLGARL